MWEEAGLLPHPTQPASLLQAQTVFDLKAHKKSPVSDPNSSNFVPRAIYESHEVLIDGVSGVLDDWPEKRERKRVWVARNKALDLLRWRQDCRHLLEVAELKAADSHETGTRS
ncbi:hypothetical protein CBOM_06427 [Ceraceosorus bombacis]|uniref:Uncharacterized protein n=1 Tax=Ceraceosorus bombacis TaxID=401625 RepID=A0A0P1BJP4_9BASI|nr:hypothetical protein CBOM_06427 [Ceraceosorus bombacis]